MSKNGESGNERSKAAAWVWYERGATSSCAQRSGDLMKRRRSNSSNEAKETMAGRGIRRQPSRFKREAAAAHYEHYLQATPPSPATAPHDHQHVDHSHPATASAAATNALQNSIIRSSEHSPQSSPAACRNCLLSPTWPGMEPAGLDHCAHCGHQISNAPRRKSESLPPVRDRWMDKIFGITSRKSFSPLHSGIDSLSSFFSTDLELDSPISLAGSFSGQLNGDGTAAAAALHSNCRSSLLDSFELRGVLKELGYEADDHDLEEPSLRSLETETRQQVLGNDFSSSPMHCKQSLYDLLGWSERGLDRKGCSCTIEVEDCSSDGYYHVESPEINIGSCSSSNCSAKATAQVRQHRRRRPSILMPHLPHSFSNALHHMHLPHLPQSFSNALHQYMHLPHFPHSFSNALHHLPHSFSNALHHLPHLPRSFSNALHQITHSLSSAHRHRHAASPHHQNADDGVGHHLHTNDSTPNGHHIESAASPRHHTHAHRHLIPPHLRHLLSFKRHHSPPHPSCSPEFDIASNATNHGSHTAPALVQHCLKSSPSSDQHLSKSDDYMLIYSSVKKHSKYHGTVHHHHHHHYIHYVY